MSKQRQAGNGNGHQEPKFAHDSEREFARILDFYQIEWEYEPRTFAIRWDDSGTPVESFAPDFYLPELELFVELTTLRQKLVTKKNRKLRRLRELYPDVNIKLFYNRDFKSLMSKYDIRFQAQGDGEAGIEAGAREPGPEGHAGAIAAAGDVSAKGQTEDYVTAWEGTSPAENENPSSGSVEEGKLSPE